ncbi:MAG: hypothetical protein HYS13_03385 [Planctomycetia bacterium]|nr:hypothetical protein [Planctomycetia bacterium]
MPQIILTDDQARLVRSNGTVDVLDSQGRLLGHIEPLGFTAEEIADAKRRAASVGPWYTGEQVRERLKVLEEAEKQRGSLSADEARELLARLRERSP